MPQTDLNTIRKLIQEDEAKAGLQELLAWAVEKHMEDGDDEKGDCQDDPGNVVPPAWLSHLDASRSSGDCAQSQMSCLEWEFYVLSINTIKLDKCEMHPSTHINSLEKW